MTQLRTIRLYGPLGARFGRVHRFHLDSGSPAEAIRALSSQFRGFSEWLASAKDRGLTFAIFIGKKNLAQDELKSPAGADDIRIAPVVIGSKRAGVLQTILGIVLIVADVFFFHTGYLTQAGIGMVAGGVVQMLSPQPKFASAKESSNQPSYVFNGAVNTEAQGHPVPLLYGRMRVGSAVISAGIEAAAYAPATPGAGPGTPGGNNKKNFYAA